MPGPVRGPAMHPGPGGRGLERPHPPGQERADDPAQHVAGAGGGQPGAAGRVDRDPAVGPGSAMTVAEPLSSTTASAAVGEPARRVDPVGTGRLADQARVLAVVRA